MLFDIKKKAAEAGNVGLKEFAKLILDVSTSQWGFGHNFSNIAWVSMSIVVCSLYP